MAQKARTALVALVERIALTFQEQRDYEQMVLNLRRK